MLGSGSSGRKGERAKPGAKVHVHANASMHAQAARGELEYLEDVHTQLHMLQAEAEGDLAALQGIQVNPCSSPTLSPVTGRYLQALLVHG